MHVLVGRGVAGLRPIGGAKRGRHAHTERVRHACTPPDIGQPKESATRRSISRSSGEVPKTSPWVGQRG